MTTSDFVDVAALLALQQRDASAVTVFPRRPLMLALRAADALDASWRTALESSATCPSTPSAVDEPRARLFEEMLAAELLLRVWTAAVSLGAEAGAGPSRSGRVASALTTLVLTQRHRLLTALVSDVTLGPLQHRLDRTRRLLERWTDVLLSVFPVTPDLALLRFDQERSRDFAESWPAAPWQTASRAEPLIIASMRAAIPVVVIDCATRQSAYSELLGAILSCFDDNAFDRSGPWKSRRRRRLERPAADVNPAPRRESARRWPAE